MKGKRQEGMDRGQRKEGRGGRGGWTEEKGRIRGGEVSPPRLFLKVGAYVTHPLGFSSSLHSFRYSICC